MAGEGQLIDSFEVKNFACLRDVTVRLTPLHAFIGPNDSGKSTLLRALRTAVHLSTSIFVAGASADDIKPFAPGPLKVGTSISMKLLGSEEYRLTVGEGDRIGEERWRSGFSQSKRGRGWLSSGVGVPTLGLFAAESDSVGALGERLERGARLVHLVPGVLREPGGLIPEDGARDFADEFGSGLPGIYDAVLNRGDDSFLKIVDGVRRLFPTVRTVRLRPISTSMKALEVELTTGERVPAAFLSEGLLFYLAFAALQYLDPVALLLVEEPENGLHPSRIADIMRILREISRTTQVVLATHSPLVINEMQGDEVSIVTRDAQGTRVKRMSDTPQFAERSQVYALGELWLSYANGIDEAPLLGEGG